MIKPILLLCSVAIAGAADESPAPMTLEQALELARENSPALHAAQIQAQAAESGVAAAGKWNNPIFKVEAEGVGWDNDLFNDGEYAVDLKQEFQLGGKRQKERSVALGAVDVTRHAVTEKEIALAADVRRAFLEVVYLQESGNVQADQEELGRAFVDVAKRRFEAGGGSELDLVQAELELEKILFSQTCCLGELIAAQEKLASLIGLPKEKLPELTAPYYELETLGVQVLADAHPTLRRLDAQAETARAGAQWARAQDTSNLTLGAGYKYEAAEEINTFVFSASMPLSFNKRGRALYAAGLLQTEAVLARRDEARRVLQAGLAEAVALYLGGKAQADMGRNSLIPKAEQAYELSLSGYEAGRFSWLELIAAQQHLTDVRIGYIEALKEAHLARIRISELTAEGM